jgi:ABC-type proline/glycine betaine transport system ATPase subunit
MTAIKINQVCINPHVDHVSLVAAREQILVLLSFDNSQTCSSLLRALAGLMPITSGAIEMSLFKHRALIFKEPVLLPWRNVWQNVGLGLEFGRAKKSENDKISYQYMEMLGLDVLAAKMPAELTEAIKYRVTLARALASGAELLLMEQPFSMLEAPLKIEAQNELLHLQKTLQKTIILSTDDLDEAFKLGHRIALFKGGQLLQVGTPEEIVLKPQHTIVKESVSHLDPTRMLKAKAIMKSVEELHHDEKNAWIFLDDAGVYRCKLDSFDRPHRSLCKDQEGRVVPWSIYQSGTLMPHDIIKGCEYLLMKDVVTAIGRTKRPMIIHDQNGKMIGAVSTESVMAAMSHK